MDLYEHEHDGHEHGGHEHGHEHGSHEHGSHEHDGHEHDGHEHGGHEHGEVLLPVLLRMARGAYSQAIRRHLAEAGLDDLPRNGPFIVGGMANQGGTLSNLVAELGVTKQAASQLIETMVTRGYLQRGSVAGDRRRMSIELTERGRRAAAAVRHGVMDVDSRLARALEPGQLEALKEGLAALARIRDDLENAPAALPGPPGTVLASSVPPLLEAQSRRVFERSGLDDLGKHLEAAHGVQVGAITQLDVGVFRAEVAGEKPGWVARVMPAQRPLERAQAERELIEFLAGTGYPAERPAGQGVSVLDGQAVVVTHFVPAVPRQDRREAIRASGGWSRVGELLGQLHTLPGAERFSGHPGGAWHHLVDGTPAEELEAARALLEAAQSSGTPDIGQAGRQTFDRLRQALEGLDGGHGLPLALVHPDFVLANILATREDGLVVVDWTGCGWGPRAWSLAFLLWNAGCQDMTRLERVVSGYRRHVQLEPEELERLPAMVPARPLVLEAWELALGRKAWHETAAALAGIEELAATVASRAVELFGG